MNPDLQIAVVAASAAIAGSLVGALVSFFASRSLSREQWRVQQIEKQVLAREQLYSDFMAEVARLALVSLDAKAERAGEFTLIYSLVSRIRLLASDAVITAAERTVRRATHLHQGGSTKFTTAEPDAEPAAEGFSGVCRRELDELRAKV